MTGRACESHVLQARVKDLHPVLRTLLLEAGDEAGDRMAPGAERGIAVLAPLSTPVGKTTPQARRDRAAYLASPQGKARARQRGSSIEPFLRNITRCAVSLHARKLVGKPKLSYGRQRWSLI